MVPAAQTAELQLRPHETHVHAASGLSLTVLTIDDRRCPPEVTCIWAGHARVRLRVDLPDGATREVDIGTGAPPRMRLPYDACVAGWRLNLQALDRAALAQPATQVEAPRIVVRMSEGCAEGASLE